MDECNVLIVDDDEIIISLLQTALKEYMPEAKVHVTQNFAEAETYIKNNPLQIALIDLHLRDAQSGVDVAHLVRQHTDAGIVFMTGDQTRHHIQEVSKVNPEAFLSKPFETDRLATILRKVLKSKQMQSVIMVEAPAKSDPS